MTESDTAHPGPQPSLYLAWSRFQRRQVSMADLVGFECVFLPLDYKGRSHARRALHYLALAWQTLRLLRQRRPATVWLQLPQLPLLWVALVYRWCFDRRVAIVADCHNAVFTPPWSRLPWGVSLLGRSDLVLVHNEDVLARCLALGVPASRTRVLEDVPARRDPAVMPPVPAAFAGRPRPWVLFAGSYGRDEPVAAVLEAARLLDQGVIAVSGRLSNAARNGHDIRQPGDRVVLTDYLPVEDFDAMMLHCDVVLALTRHDGIQLSVCNEALGFGRPMVMSDTPLLRRLFGCGAIAVDSDDPAALADGIRRAWAEPERWAQASQALGTRRRAKWQAGPLKAALSLLPAARAAQPPYPRIAMIGRLGTPQLACLRSWRRHGVPCVFLHADAAPLPRLVQRLLGVRCVHLGPMDWDDPGFVARLAKALHAEGVQALTCVSESISVALWACRDRLLPGLQLLGVHLEAARRLESKATQVALAERAGLQTLPSWIFQPGDRVLLGADHFPLVLRPDVASRANPAFKVAIVNSASECQRWVDGLVPGSSAIIAQPLVRGPNLLVHGYRSPDGRWSGHLAFRVEVKHRGLTVMMRPVPLDPAVQRGCERMEQELGLSGVFHHEFIVDERSGRTSHLDLNPRFGGTTGKVLSAGYDEPMALIGTMLEGGLDRRDFVADSLSPVGGKHQALLALLGSLRGTSTVADYPHPDRSALASRLLGYLLAGRDEIVRCNALRSLLAFALYQLRRRAAGG